MVKKRKAKPIRSRKFRDDATVGSVLRTVEELLDLPEGFVKIEHPNGRKVRSDSTIGSIRRKIH